MSGYGSTTGNRLTAGAGHSYNYDDEGNITSETETATGQVTSFVYDYRNRLTQVTRRGSGGTALAESSYAYDALDRRIRVTSDADGAGSNPAVTTWTVYDGVNPYADFDGSGQLSERYLYALAVDALLARTDALDDSDWYLTDRLGSVREVVDASTGSVEYSARYDSYGNVISASGTADRFGYTAREWDGVARLQFNRARYYDPAVGRWVSEDPIGLHSGDINFHMYTRNIPTNYGDPYGLDIYPYYLMTPRPSFSGAVLHDGAFNPTGETLGNLYNFINNIQVDPTSTLSQHRLACLYLIQVLTDLAISIPTREAENAWLIHTNQGSGHAARINYEITWQNTFLSMLNKHCLGRPKFKPKVEPHPVPIPVPIIAPEPPPVPVPVSPSPQPRPPWWQPWRPGWSFPWPNLAIPLPLLPVIPTINFPDLSDPNLMA